MCACARTRAGRHEREVNDDAIRLVRDSHRKSPFAGWGEEKQAKEGDKGQRSKAEAGKQLRGRAQNLLAKILKLRLKLA